MINENSVEFYNTRLTLDISKLKTMTASQLDQIRNYGSQAETLLTNKNLAMFVHHFKFDLADQLAEKAGHSEIDDKERIAIANQLSGIDNFVNSLKRAVYLKNKVGNAEIAPTLEN